MNHLEVAASTKPRPSQDPHPASLQSLLQPEEANLFYDMVPILTAACLQLQLVTT